MDWNLLKVFLAIARSGSLSGAASKLEVNHSTIFRRLNALEQSIGGRLFDRLANRYELTAMGQEMLKLSEGIENSFDDLQRHIIGKDLQPQGCVKITAPHNIAYRYLPGYLSDFNLLYPNIQIELLVSNQASNMNSRQADIAVRATSAPPQHLIGRRVCAIGWSVYASGAYQDKFGLPASIKQLKEHALIGATGAMRSLPAFIWLEQAHGEQIVIRVDELVAMSYLAQAGQALAVLPDDQDRPELKKLFALGSNISSELWLLTHPDLRNVARIKLLMQYLATAFASQTELQINAD